MTNPHSTGLRSPLLRALPGLRRLLGPAPSSPTTADALDRAGSVERQEHGYAVLVEFAAGDHEYWDWRTRERTAQRLCRRDRAYFGLWHHPDDRGPDDPRPGPAARRVLPLPGRQLPRPDPTSAVTSPVDPFYLRDILTCPCGALMLPTTRNTTRFYTSGDGCRRRVDAIAVETEVWQRVSHLRPTACDPSLPADFRHVLLATLLTPYRTRAARADLPAAGSHQAPQTTASRRSHTDARSASDRTRHAPAAARPARHGRSPVHAARPHRLPVRPSWVQRNRAVVSRWRREAPNLHEPRHCLGRAERVARALRRDS
jgi:hypothetical protein